MNIRRFQPAFAKLSFVLAVLFLASSAMAFQNAVVTGTAYDEKGNPLARAVVLLSNQGIGFIQTTITDKDGHFAFAAVPPAEHYSIDISLKDGRVVDRRDNIALNVGDEREILPPLREHPSSGTPPVTDSGSKDSEGVFHVTNEGKTTSVDLSKMAHEQLKYTSPHDKSEHTYSCVSLTPVLAGAGVPQGEKLRGSAMTLIVVASAKDNYHAMFSLAELDEGMGATRAYVCDADGGKPLAENEAPLKLLVTTDKRPARSVRMLTGLTVKSAE